MRALGWLSFMLFTLVVFAGTARAGEKLSFSSQIDWGGQWAANLSRMDHALTSGDYAALDTYFNGRQAAYERGEIDEDILDWEFKVFEDIYSHPQSHKLIESWVVASPNSYAANLVAGRMHRNYGHHLRGYDFASETTPTQFAGMRREYVKAAPYFLKSLAYTEKPVLSYVEILRTFYDAPSAMAVYAPDVSAPAVNGQNPNITRGEALSKAIDQIIGALTGETPPVNYTREELHKAIWHYARQGLIIAPNSPMIIDAYFELLRPRWYGSHAMMASFAETQHKKGIINDATYQYLLADMLLDRNSDIVEWRDRAQYNPKKVAALYLEALQYVDEKENRGAYYYYLSRYLGASYDAYDTTQIDPVQEKKLLSSLDYFIDSPTNPYRLRVDSKEHNQRYARILNFRSYLRVHMNDLRGGWADLLESYARGDSWGAYKVASTYCEGAPGIVQKDRAKCYEIMRQAADWGDEDAKRLVVKWGLK